jgi:hypothetical protein
LQTPPSSDIKIARFKFLFVLRLHTGIDLRDQADLAPARLVTIGSWFSDCIGASSLARCSRIVWVNNHLIEVISTHRKIGHSPSINWYQLFRLIGEFIECFYFLQSKKNQTKNYFQVRSLSQQPVLALHFHSIICFVEFVCLFINCCWLFEFSLFSLI